MDNKNLERVEIWFENGLFRAYPNIISHRLNDKRDVLELNSLSGHDFIIFLDKVNFLEIMDDDE